MICVQKTSLHSKAGYVNFLSGGGGAHVAAAAAAAMRWAWLGVPGEEEEERSALWSKIECVFFQCVAMYQYIPSRSVEVKCKVSGGGRRRK